ncbi:hypothetical protein J6590_091384 [Homalodisca vitripennis]|nr:hypothetical protein J6590_091384 [Homalodisca vitripennis]
MKQNDDALLKFQDVTRRIFSMAYIMGESLSERFPMFFAICSHHAISHCLADRSGPAGRVKSRENRIQYNEGRSDGSKLMTSASGCRTEQVLGTVSDPDGLEPRSVAGGRGSESGLGANRLVWGPEMSDGPSLLIAGTPLLVGYFKRFAITGADKSGGSAAPKPK